MEPPALWLRHFFLRAAARYSTAMLSHLQRRAAHKVASRPAPATSTGPAAASGCSPRLGALAPAASLLFCGAASLVFCERPEQPKGLGDLSAGLVAQQEQQPNSLGSPKAAETAGPPCDSELAGQVDTELQQRLPKRLGVRQYVANKEIEDRYALSELEAHGTSYLSLTVLDGHGGPQIAQWVRHRLSALLERELRARQPGDVKGALRGAYEAMDALLLGLVSPGAQMGFSRIAKVGACSLSVLVDPRAVHVANIGDCKAVMCRGGRALALSNQHTANCPAEQERLRAAHPNEADVVVCKRVAKEKRQPRTQWEHTMTWLGAASPAWAGLRWLGDLGEEERPTACYVKGRLQPTRSFGDFHLKFAAHAEDRETGERTRWLVRPPHSFPYITAEPEVASFPRTPRDEFILVASDGVWDFLQDQEATDLARAALKAGGDPQDAADAVVRAVLQRAAEHAGVSVQQLAQLPNGRRRSFHDDITVAVARLD